MKSKLMIFLLLISVAGFSQIRHDQLRKPVIEPTDTVLMFKNTSMGFEYTRTVLDTTIIKGLDLFVKERVSDSTSYLLGRLNDTVTYILGQIPTTLTDLDSTGFSVDTTQVRDLLEFVQNNGGGGSGDGYWEETTGGDTIQNNNSAPVKIQTSLLFGDEESVTGSTGLFVYAGINGTITQPIFKSSDSGSTYVPLDKEQISARFLTTNSTGQYIAFTDDMGNWYLSSDYGATWSTKSIGYAYRLNMSASGQKMIKSYQSVGTYLLSTNYGQTFSGITVNGTTGYFTNAHVSSDGGEYYLNGSESSRYVYYSTDGVNFTPFGGQLTSGGTPSFLSQDGTVFLVRDNDRIKKSINRGAWVDITPSGYADLPIEMDLSDNGSVIAITNYTLAGGYITRNGGTNWIPITSGSVKFRSVSLTSDGNIAYFGGADGKVYKYEWNEVSYALISSTPIGTGDVYLVTNKGTSSISVHPFEVRENSNYLEASVNNQTAFKINQDGQFGLRTGGFASKINTTVTGDFSALITDKAVKDYIDGSGSTMVYPAAGIPVSLGTSWRSTSISPAVGYLYYNGVNYTWNSGSSDGNNYPTTLVYTTADRQLTLGRNGLSSISTFFPLASATDAGMIKVGSGLSIDGNGVLSSSGGSMVYPSGSGIPIVNSGSWGTTISPSNGYLNYNNGTWSFSTPSGGGDMFKATYDTNSNNVVDNSEALGGVAASSYATLTGSQALTNKSVNGVTLSTAQGTTKFLRGDGSYAAPPSGVGSSNNGDILFNASGSVGGNYRLQYIDSEDLLRIWRLDVGSRNEAKTSTTKVFTGILHGISFINNVGADLGRMGSSLIVSIGEHTTSFGGIELFSTSLVNCLITGTLELSAVNITDGTYKYTKEDIVLKKEGSTLTVLNKVTTGSYGSDPIVVNSIHSSLISGIYQISFATNQVSGKTYNRRIIFNGNILPLGTP